MRQTLKKLRRKARQPVLEELGGKYVTNLKLISVAFYHPKPTPQNDLKPPWPTLRSSFSGGQISCLPIRSLEPWFCCLVVSTSFGCEAMAIGWRFVDLGQPSEGPMLSCPNQIILCFVLGFFQECLLNQLPWEPTRKLSGPNAISHPRRQAANTVARKSGSNLSMVCKLLSC